MVRGRENSDLDYYDPAIALAQLEDARLSAVEKGRTILAKLIEADLIKLYDRFQPNSTNPEQQ